VEERACAGKAGAFAPILNLLHSPTTFHTALKRLQSQLNRSEGGEVQLRDGRTIEWHSSPINVPSPQAAKRVTLVAHGSSATSPNAKKSIA
jgi:hypothetical protein